MYEQQTGQTSREELRLTVSIICNMAILTICTIPVKETGSTKDIIPSCVTKVSNSVKLGNRRMERQYVKNRCII